MTKESKKGRTVAQKLIDLAVRETAPDLIEVLANQLDEIGKPKTAQIFRDIADDKKIDQVKVKNAKAQPA